MGRIIARYLLFASFSAAAAGAPVCNDLTSFALAGGSITSAEMIEAGAFQPPNAQRSLPAFCRVAAVLRPTSDSEIGIEVWLPAANWNGKFQANGNGGWSGSINPAALSTGLARGYATAMTDTGHQGSSGRFALGHPQKLIDFGYRSSHLMTLAAKAIIREYYGRAPKLSYWVGCSAGGRQALMEAQRYPADFDGIIAGAPGMNWTGRALQSIWVAQAMHNDEASYVPPSQYGNLHRAVLQACDGLDGLQDGIIEDPARCKFDPDQLQCANGNSTECLSAAQVEAVSKVYAERRNATTHRLIFPGLTHGSELGWATMGGPQPLRIGVDLFKYVVFRDPAWDFRTFRFDQDLDRTESAENGMLNALDPDLRAFFDRGGKLIQYHGWNDPQIPPGFSVEYYRTVLQRLGPRQAQSSYRLFMVPGMAHCGGGEGASKFDMLTALEQWVENGQSPERIKASRLKDGLVDRTRPLCPYPQVAVYRGRGGPDEEASFACKTPGR